MISTLFFLKTAPVGVFDVLKAAIFFFIIIALASSTQTAKLKTPGNEHYKYYMYNIYFKIGLAIIYGAIYKYYYAGGDTMAYWNGAANLNNLLWISPSDYWNELMMTPSEGTQILHFTPETGFPPGWIYRDPHSFFVSKLTSILMIFIGQSYLVITLIFAFILSKVSWKVYDLVISYRVSSDRLAAISILFIPSVSFWCAGLSKDTVVLISVFTIIYYTFGIANNLFTKRLNPIILIILCFFTLLNTRSFMVFTVAGPLFLGLSTRVIKKYNDNAAIANVIRLFIITITMGVMVIFLKYQGEEIAKTTDKYLTEASISHDDFSNNSTYGEKKYDLGISDYSPTGMLKVAPKAILTAFYRPGIWEARSPLLLISGLETTVFIFLTFFFFLKGNVLKKIRIIRSNELLMFSISFAIILAFFAGFTSVLFGVLVRFKAPILPFLLIVITVIELKIKKIETTTFDK